MEFEMRNNKFEIRNKSVKKYSYLFASAVEKATSSIRSTRNREERKRKEIEYCHIVRSIEQYGFNEWSGHYISDLINNLKKI